MDLTIYQFVAYPAALTLWVKIPGYGSWTDVPLAPLF